MADEPTEAFRTHRNYLEAFTWILNRHAGSKSALVRHSDVLAGLASSVRQSTSWRVIPRRQRVDSSTLARTLSIAWSTEQILSLPASADDEVLAVANNWAVVQAYYVFYHATQALSVAKGQTKPQRHTQTKNLFGTQWAQSCIEYWPWSIAADHQGVRNVPARIQIDHRIHQWSGCDEVTCWSLAYKALRTTRAEILSEALDEARKRKLAERKRAWLREEDARQLQGKPARKRPHFPSRASLTAKEIRQESTKVLPVTLMDYLWRLRIRSNYKDAQMFIEGPENPGDSRQVYRYLRHLVSASLLLHELFIGQYVGRAVFEPIVDQWLKKNTQISSAVGLHERRSLLF